MDNNISRLGFLEIGPFEDKSARGGILITDSQTRPYEFRMTSPVKATPMQRVLYGNSLQKAYLDLICHPLIESINEKLDLLLVTKRELLQLRTITAYPLVLIGKPQQKDGDPTTNSAQIAILAHKNFSAEENWARSVLGTISQQVDIFEPFERIRTAVDLANKQKLEES